jgi:23S rRNA (adenine2503-C2)-methyltransferase
MKTHRFAAFRPPSFLSILSSSIVVIVVWTLATTTTRSSGPALVFARGGFAAAAFSTTTAAASSSRRIKENNNHGVMIRRRIWQTPPRSFASYSSRGVSAALSSTRLNEASSRKQNDADDKNDILNPSSSSSSSSVTTTTTTNDQQNKVLNLSTIQKHELETIIAGPDGGWGYPRYRADQVWHWIRVRGVTNVAQMDNIPKALRQQLQEYTKPSSLQVMVEQVSQKDGTVKRLYKCESDGQMIESVLMGPYDDGRYTACISSQAGCAQGCVFCATGQMGFRRQLSVDEILEQVARFAAELQQKRDKDNVVQPSNSRSSNSNNSNKQPPPRLSNIVFMGMGEPLSNYVNVRTAIQRIVNELGIGARRITVSTVGIVPRIRQMWQDPEMPAGVRLAVSLHCASDEERDALLPANRRYGGLDALLASLQEYQEGTNRRITLEWALIAGQNDSVETARKLGNLLTKRGQLRRDLLHINVRAPYWI